VFSCYEPVETPGRDAGSTVIPEGQRVLSLDQWRRLAYLAHADKREAFRRYAEHYLATDGQVYWSDRHQLAEYLDDYHAPLDRALGSSHKATEVISEIYVPRPALASFMNDVRVRFRDDGTDVIYGTIRLIERDTETALPWAREPWACIIFNIHTEHTLAGIETSARAFRGLIDAAIRYGGSYYLTYHRWATPSQVLACHPGLPAFLAAKRECDPDERFQSDWYRHYREMFA
jgi:FAD/FMN-containing dehydrogenase